MLIFKRNPLWCGEGEDFGDLGSFLAANIDGQAPEMSGEAGGGEPNEDHAGESVDGNSVDEDNDHGEDSQDSDMDNEVDANSDGRDADDGIGDDLADGDDSNSELALLKAQNAQLLEILQKMQVPKQESVDTSPEEPAVLDPFESDGFKHLSEVMAWDDDEQSAMKTFLKTFVDFNTEKTIAATQKSIPEIVNSTMSVKAKQEAIHNQFYSAHPELEGAKDYVSFLSSQVAKEFSAIGQDVNVEKVLAETAKRAYKALGKSPTKKQADKSEPERGKTKKPAFAKSGGSRKAAPKENKDAKMIADILALND